MATHEFYSTDNRHNERQIRILSVGSLVSKPPTKEKRISIKVRMPLSGTVNMGAPVWLDEAYLYVASHGGDTITPNIEFKGYSIDLSVENLFGDDIKSPDCIMRGFEISEIGNEEASDIVLSFTIRMPFTSKKWNYLGQYVGEDVWAKFIPGESGKAFVEDSDGTLLDDGENDEDEEQVDEEDSSLDEESEYDPDNGGVVVISGGKSGPKNLAAYHEGVVGLEQRSGRGRPKKTAVDPLTVNSPQSPF